jgi:hypothetical protein
MAGFNAISLKLKEMYQMITLGGDAELELVDTLDPFSEVGGLLGIADTIGQSKDLIAAGKQLRGLVRVVVAIAGRHTTPLQRGDGCGRGRTHGRERLDEAGW